MEKIYLNVPYVEKDEAKALGAKWDMTAKKWWCYPNETDKLSKWYVDTGITFDMLSDEQKHCIEVAKTGRNILVDACIGSGKTTTIQIMCNQIPDKKILYLTFNKLLKDDARKKIVAPNATVTNYDGFAYMALKNANLPLDYERNIRLFNAYKPATAHYDMLILDEYQDIKEDISEMLKIIKERNPNIQIVSVGDMEQKIYNFTALNIRNFIDEFLGDYDKLNFTTCFRLSPSHAKHLGDLWGKTIVGGNDKQETIIFHKLSEIVKFLSDKNPSDILVLGGRNGNATKILNTLEREYPDKFNKNTVYATIKDEDGVGYTSKSESAIFTTFDSSKGLERKYCVVVDLSVEYWISRADKPNSDYEILRNLFLVASSRGKKINAFFDNRDSHLASNFDYSNPEAFTRGEIIAQPFYRKFKHNDPFNPSEMYDYLFAEDIEVCMELIKIKKINTKDTTPINVTSHTGNIDLSPCIGHFVEAGFFKNYDLDREADLVLMNSNKSIKPFVRKNEKDANGKPKRVNFFGDEATIDEKILMLTAGSTDQDRYCWQVDVPFITDEEKELIRKRLSTKFTGDEEVQSPVEIDFVGSDGNYYQICGRTDVVADNTVYELKFTEELRQTHYLQLAFYLCALTGLKGVLWNIKTNEKVSVEVPDREAFLKQTVRAITKRAIYATEFFETEKNNTVIEKAERKRKGKQRARKAKKAKAETVKAETKTVKTVTVTDDDVLPWD